MSLPDDSSSNSSNQTESSDTLTKASIVAAMNDKLGMAKKESVELVELIFQTMKETLASGEKIKISGFGNFVLRDKQARRGRNPQTGESIKISARRVLGFKPSQILKEAVDKARAERDK